MRLGVRWETTYRYSKPVRLLHTELRVLPADGFGQRLVSDRLRLEPEARPLAMHDAFGNRYHHVDFLAEVDRLHVAVEAEIETQEGPLPDGPLTPLFSHLFTQPTRRAPFDPAIEALARELPSGVSVLEMAEAVMELLGDRFEYELGHTNVAATAVDLVAMKHGVCQDFSHLALSLLRMQGLPARYVSGYLAPREGEEMADASHAWVQVFDGDEWHGFDPANRTRQDGHYVTIGVGRDYDDVSPLRGTYQGTAEEEYSTSVLLRTNGNTPTGQGQQHPSG